MNAPVPHWHLYAARREARAARDARAAAWAWIRSRLLMPAIGAAALTGAWIVNHFIGG